MTRPIEGRSILITGGGSGIGAGAAEHLVGLGALVTVVGRRAGAVEVVAERLGDRCLPVAADVTVAADRARMVEAAVDHGGGLEAVINNAGNMYRAPVDQLDEAELLGLFHTNVVGAMLLVGLARPHLAASCGSVVFVGSVHTKRAFPGVAAYAATKGAVETLTAVLAAELGPDQIRVNCVRPGAVPTEINVRAGLATPEESVARLEGLGPAHALGRIGTPRHVAEAFEYLIRADWTTGTVLTVDGGLSLGVTRL